MGITSTRHVESVMRGGAASVVRRIAWYPSQEVEQVRGRHCGLPGDSGAVRSPPQEVEQGGYGYCGLSGNDGTARSPPQEVEQGRGHFEGLSGGADLSIGAR